jgi:cytochrome P450
MRHALSRGHVERLRPRVAQRAQTLVDQLAERIAVEGCADLLATLAALPIEVIAELLGIPPADRSVLRLWSNSIVKMYEGNPDSSHQHDAEQAAADFTAYLRDLLTQRRTRHHAGNDLISDLVAVTDADGTRLSEDELVATAVLLFMAGFEASVNVVGNGVLALMHHRDQWQRLIDDPGLAVPAVEELIRYDSPLQLFERTAIADVTVAGYPVPAGGKIAACSVQPDEILTSSFNPIAWISAALPIHTWASAPESITVSELRWPASKPRLRCWPCATTCPLSN